MVIGNGKSCTSVFQNTRAWGQQELNQEGKKRGVSMKRSKAGTKERSLDGLSLPNQAILINIIWYYFTRYEKSTMKFN